MSCWVVTSVAAELWGCTIDAVLARIRNGNVPSKEEAGWTFVDVAPDSPKMESPKTALQPLPESYSIVSHAESEALNAPMKTEDEVDMSDWRRAREAAANSRRAPLRQAA